MTNPPIDGQLIYSVEVPAEVRAADKYADIAEAYAVEAGEHIPGGCIIWGLYHGEWIANISARWLVLHLLTKAGCGPGREGDGDGA